MTILAGVDPLISVPFSVQPDAVAVYVPNGEGVRGAGISVLKAQQVPHPSCSVSLKNSFVDSLWRSAWVVLVA